MLIKAQFSTVSAHSLVDGTVVGKEAVVEVGVVVKEADAKPEKKKPKKTKQKKKKQLNILWKP